MRSIARTHRGLGRRLVVELLARFAVVGAIMLSYALGGQALAGALLPADTRYYAPPNFYVLLGLSLLPGIFLGSLVVAYVSGRIWPSRRRPLRWGTAYTIGTACATGLLLLGLLGGISSVRRVTDEGVTWRDVFELSDHRYAWSQVVRVELDTTLQQTRSG